MSKVSICATPFEGCTLRVEHQHGSKCDKTCITCNGTDQ